LELELPPEAAEVDAYPVGVQFFDADGYVWVRDVRTGKVKREGAVHRGAGVSWIDMRPVMRMAKGGRPHSLWARDKMPWIPRTTPDED
jgi:ligand-binding sensor domain-containing protein